jgi:CobQ-like glutamine amidotransferase family enzyme
MNDELIRNMLDSIALDQGAEAQQIFNDIISVKLTDALDQRKTDLARKIGAHDAIQADS